MRTINLDEVKLKAGSHSSIEEGSCIMEMVSYMANEPWSDHPQCACPILTEYSIRLNDIFSDEHRQQMKEFIPLLIGTRKNDETQIARERLIRWRNVTVTFPLILDVIGAKEHATEIRKFENNFKSMAMAASYLIENKEAIRKIACANAYVDAYAYANAYVDAYAYANANADAYANAYAKKLREEIVKVSLETLRMAIELSV